MFTFLVSFYCVFDLGNHVHIDQHIADKISYCLRYQDVKITSKSMEVTGEISWNSQYSLTLDASQNLRLRLESKLTCNQGNLVLRGGSCSIGTVIFDWPQDSPGIYAPNCKVRIYYNPPSKGICKYHHRIKYWNNVHPTRAETSYMWIHT